MALTAFFRLQNKNVFDVLDIYKTALLQRTLKKISKCVIFSKCVATKLGKSVIILEIKFRSRDLL